MIIVLVALSFYYAWRYSKISIDPDWAMFNFEAFLGSWYGRDYVDCKTPAIHVWYWLIAKVVGKDIVKVKFAHHLLIGMLSIPILLVSGNGWVAFAYLILVQSGWLFAFHGNVGQQPAAFITLALVVPNPYVAMVLWWLALVFEPKLILAYLGWLAVGLLWQPALITLVVGLVVLLIVYMLRDTDVVKWMVYQNITIPGRMQKERQKLWKYYLKFPYLGSALFLLVTWMGLAILSEKSILFFIPPALFVMLTLYGLAIRPNHLLPLIPWIAVGIGSAQPATLLVLTLADLLSSGLYLTDIWQRFYPGLRKQNSEVRVIGEWLKGKPGDIFVNDLHSGVYIYALKPIVYGMVEQIEIREVADERRKLMLQLWKENPAKWVVVGPEPFINFTGEGYTPAVKNGEYTIWKRIR